METESETDLEPNAELLSKPIYLDATITVGAAVAVLMAFAQRFKLPGTTLSALIQLLNVLLPKDHLFPKSLYQLKIITSDSSPQVKTHNFCKICLMRIDPEDIVCPNPKCIQSDPKQETFQKSFFLEFDISSQIKSIFSRTGMLEKLFHRFNRSENSHTDIYDGSLYQAFSKVGSFLSYPQNISFLWNTDGIPVFKSTKSSLWPMLYTINELPFHDRVRRENILISGLWCGDCHPNMLSFLSPQMETLNHLKVKGVRINEDICIRAMVLCGSCDLPAKASVLNFQPFNAFYGCPKCLQRGETVFTENSGNVRCFPFQESNPSGPLRTHHQTMKDAKSVLLSENKKPINGVKGPSALMLLPDYDIICGTSIDYMNGALLGVTKLFLSFWFDSSHKKKEFSIFNKLDIADKRLLALKPPNYITRAPRSIKLNLCYWKASEFRSFLLYYFVPVLYRLLPDFQFQHFYLFAQAIYLLLKSRVTAKDIATAKRFLFLFVYLFDRIYPRRYMTMNVHSLLHFADTVKELGPLYIYSLFHFEDKNGYILKLIHGTQNISQQLATAVSSSHLIPILCDKMIDENTNEKRFLDRCSGFNFQNKFFITKNISGIGSLKNYKPPSVEKLFLEKYYIMKFDSALSFPSIKISGFTIRSRKTTKEKRRNSTTVFLSTSRFFSIENFACFTSDGTPYYIAFGHLLERKPTFYFYFLMQFCAR